MSESHCNAVNTTNELGRLSDRLLSRCEVLEFAGTGEHFEADLVTLCKEVYKRETGRALRTIPEGLGRFDLASGTLSIRLALQQLAPYMRGRQRPPKSLRVPFIREVANGVCQSGSAAARKAWDTRRRKAAVQ